MAAAAFRIQPYRAPHHDAVARLVLDIQCREFGLQTTYEEQPDLQDPAIFFRRGAGEFLVAEAAGQPVGTIGLVDIGNGQGALRKMFVAPAWRGKERGVAHELLTVLLAHAARHGIDDIFLGTTDKFQAAHRFYARNGFLEIAVVDLPPAFPRAKVDTVFFRRRGR